ncbi:hypothetical protein Agub_g6321 [Astrephomene gubernaculifera]|uniref:Uncharacterized protein n=1 Tax=Astrephomene gubernaculifera TaxID=47775 RepID=A0AAD3DN94_9CHLO|nr:hypothetical protein Agub_g6321 [Astrephomene gubernaculifera]
MVYDSPAAGRILACRKHSPWTMERDRKKSKARLGSPECQDVVSEGIEEEEEEPDDHEMTEQEAHVLACLGQLSVAGLLGGHGDVPGGSLPRSDSAPEGQRRKVRGSRALSASYQNRLRSCVLSDKGSPVRHSSRSYGGDCDQENVPPVTFSASEHSKCWLARRHSPPNDAPAAADQHHRVSTTSFALQARNHTQVPNADQSLAIAAAAAGCTRLKQEHQQDFDDSPAPKSRSHRRSQSGAGADAHGAHGLTDSAETLHGHASCADGVRHGVASSVATERRHVPNATTVVGCSSLPLFSSTQVASQVPIRDVIGRATQGSDSCGRCPSTAFSDGRISASALGSSAGSCAPVAKYGIAAFGVAASVKSCFAGPISASAVRHEPGAADKGSAQLSCFATKPTVTLTSPSASGEAVGADCQAEADAAKLHSGSSSPLRASLSPLVGGLGRCANMGLAGGSVKALADSAEEIELRRLAQQRPHPPILQPERSQQLVEPQPSAEAPLCSFFSGPAAPANPSLASASAQPTTFTLAPFDLAALARSNLCGTSFMPEPNTVTAGPTAAAVPNTFTGSVGGPSFAAPKPAYDESNGAPGAVVAAGRKQQQQRRDSFQDLQDMSEPRSRDRRTEGAAGDMEQDAGCVGLRTPGLTLVGSPSYGQQGLGRSFRSHHDGAFGSSASGYNDDECEDGTPWLRTSQQVPDPDDPSSADKYSQVLLMRLQAAAEHEELYSAAAAAAGCPSGPCGLYHLQGHGSGGLRYDGYAPRPFGSNSSSMEPSPMPRLSSRLRRLRASPYGGGSGGNGTGGSLFSPPPSQLGTRSRSAGVTPGGTSRRLRRRSDLASGRSYGDVDDDVEEDCGDDHRMFDAGHQHTAHQASGRNATGETQPCGVPPSSRACASDPHGQPLSAPLSWLAGICADADGKPSHEEVPRQRGASAGGAPPVRPSLPSQEGCGAGADRRCQESGQRYQQHRSRSHPGEEFLNGLMDYDDDGAEFSTPPHTPLRGIGNTHDHDAAAATHPLPDTADTSIAGTGPAPVRAPGNKSLFGDSTGPVGRCGGGGRLRDAAPTPHAALGGRQHSSDGCAGGAMEWLASGAPGSTQDFNKWIGWAANNNDRGCAERLWHEMCSRSVAPDINTLNALLRCLSRSVADPEEANLLVCDVCCRGGFSPNGTSQRLLEEICFRFEQLNGSLLEA